MSSDPIDWPMMYHRHPELLALGDKVRNALGALGTAAIAWSATPQDDSARDLVLGLALDLRVLRDMLDSRARALVSVDTDTPAEEP